MTQLSFGPQTTSTGTGQTVSDGVPLLSFGGSAGIGQLPFPTSQDLPFSLGTTVPTNQAALALSGPLGGGGTPNNPSPSTVAAQQAAAAAANAGNGNYGAGGFVYSLGQLAAQALAPAANNTPSIPATPASYSPGGGSATGGGSILSGKTMEIGLLLVAGLVAWEMFK